jgi:cytochrome c-type biogenesis protein CcmH/NrfF
LVNRQACAAFCVVPPLVVTVTVALFEMPLQFLVLVAVVALVLKQQRQFMLVYPLSDGYS